MAANASTPALRGWQPEGVLRYELVLPLETPSNNVIKGMHFQAYKQLRHAWRMMVKAALKGKAPEAPVGQAFLVVVRECAGGGLDWDNAYGGLKPVLDCLVAPSVRNPDGLGLIVDDNPRNMPYPPFLVQMKAPLGQGKTTIQIYELPGSA